MYYYANAYYYCRHCDQLMALYYETVDKLVASNRELHICQQQLKQRDAAKLSGRHNDNQSGFASPSLISENTDQELGEISEDDNDYEYDSEDDEEEDDSDDDDETELESSGSSASSAASTLTVKSATLTGSLPRMATGRSRKSGGLSRSWNIASNVDMDSNANEHGSMTAQPAVNSAARARRQSKRVTSSYHDLRDKVHPVLHRRDPSKSIFDAMKAGMVGVDADNAPRHNLVQGGQINNIEKDGMRSKSRGPSVDLNTKISPSREINAQEGQISSHSKIDNSVQIIEDGFINNQKIHQDRDRTNQGELENTNVSPGHHKGIDGEQGLIMRSGHEYGDLEKSPLQDIPPPYPRRPSSKCSRSAVFDTSPSRASVSRIPTWTSMDLSSKNRPVASPRMSLSGHHREGQGQVLLKPVMSDEPTSSKSSPRSELGSSVNNRSIYKPLPQINPANHTLKESEISTTENGISERPHTLDLNGRESMDKDSLEYTSHSLSDNKPIQQLVN